MTNFVVQDGEIWTFSVRAFDSTLPTPERTINVNYEGFAEGLFRFHYYRNVIQTSIWDNKIGQVFKWLTQI